MKARFGLVVLAALAAAPAFSAETVRLNLGYGFSGDYTLRNGNTASLSGPTIGVEILLAKFGDLQIGFEPSVFLGGRLSKGSDKDGDVFRFLLTARHPLPGKLIGLAGIGYAHSSDRGNQFEAESGVVGKVGVAFPLEWLPLGIKSNEIQATYMIAGNGQLSGFFFGLGVGF